MVEIKNLSITEKKGGFIIENVSLSLEVGQCIALTGASGSGKTTLLKALIGLLNDDCVVENGDILLEGLSLLKKSPKERKILCGKTFGFIPQNPMTSFFPNAKIGKQMVETLRLHHDVNRKEAEEEAESCLLKVNLTDTKRVMHCYPSQLSGGMLQRIAMAMILATKPQYILADEPESALDEENRNQLLRLLADYKEAGLLIISHNAQAIRRLATTVHVMESGRIIETQATEALFSKPLSPWTKQFVAVANTQRGGEWIWNIWK